MQGFHNSSTEILLQYLTNEFSLKFFKKNQQSFLCCEVPEKLNLESIARIFIKILKKLNESVKMLLTFQKKNVKLFQIIIENC